MEAQRLSLSQVHAAQLELLQEEAEAHTHSLELKLQQQSGRGEPGREIQRSITGLLSLPVAFVNSDCCIYVNPCFGLVCFFLAGPKLLQTVNVSQVVQKECTEIMKVFLMTGCYY